MRVKPAKSWSLPGGDRKIVLPNGQETTLADMNQLRWSSGIGLCPTLLRDHQMPLYQHDIGLNPFEIGVELCARQFGKSFEKLALAVEKGISLQDVRILFAFPGKGQGQGILEINIKRILATCPPDLMPDVRLTEGRIRFPRSGSLIEVVGTDDNDQRERLRGSGSPLIIVDEAGSHKDLRYLVDDVLAPQLDNYDGVMILVTTPPKTLDHPFTEFHRKALGRGKLLIRTINDNSHYSREKKLRICAGKNGFDPDDEWNLPEVAALLDGTIKGSPTWRREYLCEMVSDESLRVVPYYEDSPPMVEAFKRPPHCAHYVFIDQAAGADFFAAVFCSHKFEPGGGRLFVESVWQDKMKSTDFIAENMKRRERELGWNPKYVRRYLNDPRGNQQRIDLIARNYHVIQAGKSEGAQAEGDRLNMAVKAGRVVVHAACNVIREQMMHGIYKISDNGAKADFLRSEQFGHLDALAALAMGVKCVNWRLDHTPADEIDVSNFFVPPGMKKPLTENQRAVWGMFQGIKN